ncbi:MAG TPA: hypothetical protein DHW31_08435 [Bacteroides graminisolvens]|uniref:Uncharacterized protein n=1 Tax=Bacteroides graminisolvens TaxID=477666 RepID=A0A3D2SGR6_9BACE|nr:hypothetical protein [Bacteroides graminisolvens]
MRISSIERFRFFVGGYGRSNCEVNFQGSHLSYWYSEFCGYPGETHEKVISNMDMVSFLSKLNQLGITRWKRKYESCALDGTQWELEVLYNGARKKKIYGSNAYPGSSTDSAEETVEFRALLDAIRLLIGEPGYF